VADGDEKRADVPLAVPSYMGHAKAVSSDDRLTVH
jgi:hypothetical protein